MDEYERMLDELQDAGVIFHDEPLPNCDGLYRETPQYKYINVNRTLPKRQRLTALAHEIGHLRTMSLIGTPGQIEMRAIKYAVFRIVPLKRLVKAIQIGHRTIYELAEHFDVDEKFMRQALHIYGLSI